MEKVITTSFVGKEGKNYIYSTRIDNYDYTVKVRNCHGRMIYQVPIYGNAEYELCSDYEIKKSPEFYCEEITKQASIAIEKGIVNENFFLTSGVFHKLLLKLMDDISDKVEESIDRIRAGEVVKIDLSELQPPAFISLIAANELGGYLKRYVVPRDIGFSFPINFLLIDTTNPVISFKLAKKEAA